MHLLRALVVVCGASLSSASISLAETDAASTGGRAPEIADTERLPMAADGVTPACTAKGIRLAGRVKVVEAFADLTVRKVEAFPDLRVKRVTAFADDCGEWMFVDAFPDFTIRYVDAFADVTIKEVDAFPGVP
jgi:hypothetical protein